MPATIVTHAPQPCTGNRRQPRVHGKRWGHRYNDVARIEQRSTQRCQKVVGSAADGEAVNADVEPPRERVCYALHQPGGIAAQRAAVEAAQRREDVIGCGEGGFVAVGANFEVLVLVLRRRVFGQIAHRRANQRLHHGNHSKTARSLVEITRSTRNPAEAIVRPVTTTSIIRSATPLRSIVSTAPVTGTSSYGSVAPLH